MGHRMFSLYWWRLPHVTSHKSLFGQLNFLIKQSYNRDKESRCYFFTISSTISGSDIWKLNLESHHSQLSTWPYLPNPRYCDIIQINKIKMFIPALDTTLHDDKGDWAWVFIQSLKKSESSFNFHYPPVFTVDYSILITTV